MYKCVCVCARVRARARTHACVFVCFSHLNLIWQILELHEKSVLLQKDELSHKAALKGGVFRLNMHPVDQFDSNPYRNDKGLPPVRKLAGDHPDKTITTPFKPSNPGKLV